MDKLPTIKPRSRQKTRAFMLLLLGVALVAAAISMATQGFGGSAAAANKLGAPAAASPDSPSTPNDKEDPSRVEKGDLVKVNYSILTEDGRLVTSTLSRIGENAKAKKAEWYAARNQYRPEEIVADSGNWLAGLGESAIGMQASEKKSFKLADEKAFGPRDESKVVQLPCTKSMPKVIRLDPSQYLGNFKRFPVVGKEVSVVPYFNARVTDVKEDYAELEFMAKDEKIQDAFGTTDIKVKDSEIVLTIEAKTGATFEVDNRPGRIVQTDGQTFTVDFNHPLAGKAVTLDMEVVGLTKASAFKKELPWLEDHDLGMARAKSDRKRMFLLLYAGWCGWSKKMMNESLQDPRIKVMQDQFVWVKVDSDKEQAVKEAYQQSGYPLLVVLDEKGDVLKKIDGYRDAAALKKELEEVL
jgi:FKBP-type peptidyl-prolyl cis-trans isomerase 2